MKRHLFLFAAAALALTACDVEIQEVAPEQPSSAFTIRARIDEAATKIATENGLAFKFQENDQIGVYIDKGVGTEGNDRFDAQEPSQDGWVTFVQKTGIATFEEGDKVYAYAPYVENLSTINCRIEETRAGSSWGIRAITLENEQVQSVAGDYSHLANYYKMVATPAQVGPDGLELSFSSIFSLVKFGFKNESGKDICIKSMEFSAENAALTGKFNVDLKKENPSLSNSAYDGVTPVDGETCNKVSVSLSTPSEVAAGNADYTILSAVVNPGTYTSPVVKVYATLTEDNVEKDVVFTVNLSGKTFTRLTRAAVAVALTNYEEVVSNIVTNDAELASALNEANPDIMLAAGNYAKVVLPVPNVNPTSGTGTTDDPYYITRVIETLTIDGPSDAKLEGLDIFCGSNVVYRNPAGNTNSPNFNDELTVSAHPSYYYIVKDIEIGTLTIKNITMTDAFDLHDANSGAKAGNIKANSIVFENVTFDMNGVTNSVAARVINKDADIKNIIFRNCTFVNCVNIDKPIAVDIRTADDVNITVEGCTFDAAKFNAMQFSGTGSNFTGTITIKDSEINNTVDRGIRISKATGNLVITGNTMVNAADADGEAMKWGGPHASLVFENNTLDGAALEVIESGSNYVAKAALSIRTIEDLAAASETTYDEFSDYVEYTYYDDKTCTDKGNNPGVKWVKTVTFKGLEFGELKDGSASLAALAKVIDNYRRRDTGEQFKNSIVVNFEGCTFSQSTATFQVYKVKPCEVTDYNFIDCTFTQTATGQYALTLNVNETLFHRGISYSFDGCTFTSAGRGINIIPGTETESLEVADIKVVFTNNTFALPQADDDNMAVQIAGNWDAANLSSAGSELIEFNGNNVTAYCAIRVHNGMSNNATNSAKYILAASGNELATGTLGAVAKGSYNATTAAIAAAYDNLFFPAAAPDWAEVSEGVYEIYTKEGMFWFADQVNTNANTFKNQTVRLANNIDLENEPWTPVGPSTTYDHEFQGTFDGNGKTISRLYCVNEGQAAGLFGYASIEKIGPTAVAYIKDVTIDNATVASHHYAGAVAAWVQGGYTVQNCHVTNSTITSTVENNGSGWDNGDKVGGVVGYIAQSRTTVTGCSISNSTITGYRDLGGVVGCVATADISYVTNNTVGENVKLVQDLNHSYKSKPSGIPCGSIVGRGASDNISGNTGTAAIIVKAHDTAQAQLALDAAATARTIELAAGTYDELIVRHTQATTQITNNNYYHRTLENITIKAADDATVSVNGITINSGHTHTADQNNPAINYVVNEEGQAITGTTNYNYFGYFLIRNLVIDGFTLTKNVYIGADSSTETNRYFDADGITLQNCQMIGTDATKKTDNGSKLIRIGGPLGASITNPLRIRNVVVRNCKAKEVFQGVYAYGPVDYTVENCEFDNLGHNVLQVGAGKVTFQNNVIKNCNTDRVFRISAQNYPAEDWVRILNNTLTNTAGDPGDANNPIIKIGNGAGTCDITFEGNTMDAVDWSPLQ